MPATRIKVRVRNRQIDAMRRLKWDGARRYVTIVQDTTTKAVLGVMVGRHVRSKFFDKLTDQGVDTSHAELIDFEIQV